MLNYNGKLLPAADFNITTQNRAFKYGDGLFETLKVVNNRLVFWEDHYFRLMASMRMLRMEIPMAFTLEFLESEILKTLKSQNPLETYRVRLSVYRKDGGLYSPVTNQIDYIIEGIPYSYSTKETYTIDLFKDYYNYSGMLSTIKTNNRILNTLASIYMEENELDNCVLLNERKGVVEAINANLFIVKGTTIKTPALSEGCIKGVVRKKIIELLEKNKEFTLEETVISPFELQKADELFLTNSIMGIQPVTNYRKKILNTVIGKQLQNSFKVQTLTGMV